LGARLSNAPLRDVARQITELSGVNLPLDPSWGDTPITSHFDNAPAHDVLDAVFNRARIGWRVSGVRNVSLTAWTSREGALAKSRALSPELRLSKDHALAAQLAVLLVVRDVPLAEALRQTASQTGCRISYPAPAASLRVSGNFHYAPLREVLDTFLAPHRLDFRFLGEAEVEIYQP
jgi:hypothetical protein